MITWRQRRILEEFLDGVNERLVDGWELDNVQLDSAIAPNLMVTNGALRLNTPMTIELITLADNTANLMVEFVAEINKVVTTYDRNVRLEKYPVLIEIEKNLPIGWVVDIPERNPASSLAISNLIITNGVIKLDSGLSLERINDMRSPYPLDAISDIDEKIAQVINAYFDNLIITETLAEPVEVSTPQPITVDMLLRYNLYVEKWNTLVETNSHILNMENEWFGIDKRLTANILKPQPDSPFNDGTTVEVKIVTGDASKYDHILYLDRAIFTVDESKLNELILNAFNTEVKLAIDKYIKHRDSYLKYKYTELNNIRNMRNMFGNMIFNPWK